MSERWYTQAEVDALLANCRRKQKDRGYWEEYRCQRCNGWGFTMFPWKRECTSCDGFGWKEKFVHDEE